MTNKLFRPATYRFLLSLVVVSALCVTVTSTAHAGLFALNSTSGTIGSYAFDGTTVQNPLVNTGLDFAQGLAIWNNTLFVADSGTGDVLAYDATTGAPAGGFTTITGLTSTSALAVSGNSLYVLSFDSLDSSGIISEYTTGGTLLHGGPIITGLAEPGGIAVGGGNIYVTNQGGGAPGGGTISKYTTSGGAPVNANLVTSLDTPLGLTLLNGNLYVANSATGVIGAYTDIGGSVSPSLITGLNMPWAVSGNQGILYFTSYGGNSIGSYNLDTLLLTPDLVTGLDGPTALVAVIPEPGEWSLLAAGLVVLVVVRRIQMQRRLCPAVAVSVSR